ncbi:acyltransferase family protein [Flavobacterium zhairuonense]|uniref:acyltransferase n=1 Tax=Flavobacterium zhairuonense TaxID=2493631 RepID=UPI0010517B87|nr:acyltransferase family protein [Flavobacterium zhairuonense]KAF2510806.1 acyltransferase family protein [Flavobacterium zhairuonense]
MKNENVSFETQFGLSFLRIMATFSVILIHVSASLVTKYGQISFFDWNVANFFDSISRYSVPMFFMISGALLLGRDYELIDFLKKRLGKILPPFIIWSTIYSLLNRYLFGEDSFNLVKVVKDVFYGSKYHLWFIFALLGVYLMVPILRKWIKNASNKEIQYVLIIWLLTVTLTIPNLKIYFPKINLVYFSGYIGYFILGYYLSMFKFKIVVPISFIILGLTITFLGTCHFTVLNSEPYYYFYEHLSLNTFLVSSGLFMLFNKAHSSNKNIHLFVERLNQLCFGIYLMHPLVLDEFNLIGFNVYTASPVISILMLAFVCFFVCSVITFCFKQLRYGYLIV